MTVNGLPLHPLIVHLVVVAAPLTAVGALVYAVVPRWRWALRWPLVVTAVVAAAATQLAAMSGDNLKSARHFSGPAMDLHETWAGRMQAGTWVLAAVVLLAFFALPVASRVVGGRDVAGRLLALRPVISGLLVVLAVAEVYLVYRTGDAGAKLVWSANG